jgi:hypothetical protein
MEVLTEHAQISGQLILLPHDDADEPACSQSRLLVSDVSRKMAEQLLLPDRDQCHEHAFVVSILS